MTRVPTIASVAAVLPRLTHSYSVGYGDRSPAEERPGMRVVCILMISLGVSFIFPLLSSGVEFLSSVVMRRAREALARAFPVTYVDVDGDGEFD